MSLMFSWSLVRNMNWRNSVKAILSMVLVGLRSLGTAAMLNAGGEGGLLHAGVLGSYSGAVVAGDFSLNPPGLADPVAVSIEHAGREERVNGTGNGF